MTTYCEYSRQDDAKLLHKQHHDVYGYPLEDDNDLFGRLLLEINQAGLNWELILKREPTMKKAYSNFNIKKVANYKAKDTKRLLGDPGIIRNKLKVKAAIYNANVILNLQKDFGSFKGWLDSQTLTTKDGWTKLFKQTFTFTGGEIVNEFLMSTGYLPGGHDKSCHHYAKVLKKKPYWSR